MNTSFFESYIHQDKTFQQFGVTHIWALIISILLIISIPLLAKKHLSTQMQIRLGQVIGWTIFINYFLMTALKIAGGVFDIKTDLPFQLCQFSNLLVILVMHYRKYLWFEILYCWAFAGMLNASITPDLQYEFPHFLYFRYWIGHPGMLLAMIYAIVVFDMRPTLKSIGKAMIAINVFFVCVVAINLLLDSNYFFVCHKPSVPSLLDYFGPWPWYLVTCEFFLLFNFSVVYLPFGLKNYFAKNT